MVEFGSNCPQNIAVDPAAATGSFDAGVACAGHVRGVAADVRVDAAEDVDPMLCPVIRLALTVVFNAVAIFHFGGYRAADSTFILAGPGGRLAMRLDFAKNPLCLR